MVLCNVYLLIEVVMIWETLSAWYNQDITEKELERGWSILNHDELTGLLIVII